MALLPLPPQVVSRIRSGVSLVSPSQCLAELIFNSIDAGATNIVTHLDLSCHKMQVKDNGMGMTPDHLKMVGERYCTSKCHSLNDLSNLRNYGYRGEALASLREISGMMEIISKTSSCDETYCKLFVQGEAKEVTKSSSTREQNGTTITVLDFMYNLPVRKKMISETLDLEHCRGHLARIALIHPHISFILYNDATEEVILQTHKSKSILASFVTLFGQRKAEQLKPVQCSTPPYKISGYISLQSHTSKDLQFLYVNSCIVLKTKLHKIINSLLKKYLLVCHRIPIFSSPNKSLAVSSQDRHAIFVLNICCPSNSYDLCLEPKKSLIEFKEWIRVLNLIEKCVCRFLKDNNVAVEESETEDNSLVSSLTGNVMCSSDNSEINTYNTKNALFSLIAKRDIPSDLTEKELPNEIIEDIGTSIDNSRKGEIYDNHLNPGYSGQRQRTEAPSVMSRFNLGTSHNANPSSNENMILDNEHCNEFPTERFASTLTAFKRKAKETKMFTKIQPKEKIKFITVGNKVVRLPTVMKPCYSRNALHQLKSTRESRFAKLRKSYESMENDRRKIRRKSSYKETQKISTFSENYNFHKSRNCSAEYFDNTSNETSTVEYDAKCKEISTIENDMKIDKIQEDEQNKILQLSSMDKSDLKTTNISSLGKSDNTAIKTCKEIRHINKSNDVLSGHNMNSSDDTLSSQNLKSPIKQTKIESLVSISHISSTQKQKSKSSELLVIDNTSNDQPSGVIKTSCNEVDIEASTHKDDKENKTRSLQVLNSQACEKFNAQSLQSEPTINRLYQEVNHISAKDKIDQHSNNCAPLLDVDSNVTTNTSEESVTINPSVAVPNSKQNYMKIKFSPISNEERLKQKLWICHKDVISGHCIYVNSINANSTYNLPEAEVTKDDTVDVSGKCNRSHFFLSHNSTPFLPRPSLQRTTIWTKLKSRALFRKDDELTNASLPCMQLIADKASTNVGNLFQSWKNPVFQRQDFKEITNIGLKQIAKREVKIYNLTQPHNLSKNELYGAKVIGQVDSKFIACLVPKCEKDMKANDFIVLFDQHAVHERIRLEQLIQDLYENGKSIQKIKSSLLESTVNVKLRPEELRIIKAYNNELNRLGFTLHINDQNSATVSTIPSCLLEKESNDKKKGKYVSTIVIETILKEWVQMLQETGVATSLPKTLLSVLNSQACHGAIKFGDHLQKAKCSELITMLTSCKLPFQCAHGRPSLVPLVDLSSFSQSETKMERPQLWKLAKR